MRGLRLLLVAALAVTAACTDSSAPIPADEPFEPATVADEGPTRIAVIGDWGAGTRMQERIARAMCKRRRTSGFRVVITTGDNFYDPDGVARRHNYRDPQSCLIEASGHRWRASWGNHDVRGLSTRRVLGAERWYTWKKAGARFIALDSTQWQSDEQRRWLRRRLARSDERIKIVYFHHPPFTVGSVHPDHEGVKERWVPLFQRYDVTLVLNGHNHAFEHSRVRGVDYIVTGGGGQVLYPCVREPETLIKCEAIHHFLVMTILEKRVVVRVVGVDGKTIDRVPIRS